MRPPRLSAHRLGQITAAVSSHTHEPAGRARGGSGPRPVDELTSWVRLPGGAACPRRAAVRGRCPGGSRQPRARPPQSAR